MHPVQEACAGIDDEIFCYAMLADKNEGTVYSDLTGKFPVQSFDGHLYLFVCYVYSANAIIMRPMQNRSDECMVKTFKDVYDFLTMHKHKPKLHVLDNECSRAVQKYIKSQSTDIQLVEPHNHRVNAAEPAIKSAKYHIIAGLQTVDPNCPLQLWHRFIEQMQDTLNLLRTSREDPNKSAFEQLQGRFDYNRTPMAILGTQAVAFLDPAERASWQSHGVDCYVVGRCPLHYRLIEFFNPQTRAYFRTGTYSLYPQHSTVPTISEQDRTLTAAQDIMCVCVCDLATRRSRLT
jgi:hypothetical protein